jgi:hypothetical protein
MEPPKRLDCASVAKAFTVDAAREELVGVCCALPRGQANRLDAGLVESKRNHESAIQNTFSFN